MLDANLIEWLLQSKIPSIRYQTLRHLLNLPEQDPVVTQARQEIQVSGPAPIILAQQSASGNWSGESSYYTPKYTSTHWSMLLLAELEAGPSEALQRGANFMLNAVEKRYLYWVNPDMHGLACFWGNLLRYVTQAGLQDDPRLGQVMDLLSREVDTDWRCKYNAEEPCAWGAVRALWAFAGLSDAQKTPAVQRSIQGAVQFLFKTHDFLQSDYPCEPGGKVSALWSRLSFPLFYQADRLLALRALMELDLLALPEVQGALDWLGSLREANGQWRGSSPFRTRTWREVGDTQETRRWISLQAARVWQAAGR